MLVELHITNLAIIESEAISFGSGLNVISGETGAGKSILLQAVDLILGGRPKIHSIRDGADGLEVQALFDLSSVPLDLMQELPDIVNSGELLISRTVNRLGKGKVYVNGRLGSVGLVEEIGSRLINVCGQTQHVRLLDPGYHLTVVDHFAGLHGKLAEYGKKFLEWKEKARLLEEAKTQQARRAERREELTLIIEELTPIGLRKNLRIELESEIKTLASREKIVEVVQTASSRLGGDGGVLEQISDLSHDLEALKKLDARMGSSVSRVEEAQRELVDLFDEIERYGNSLNLDEEKIEELRSNLAELARVERKYKKNDEDLQKLLTQSEHELSVLEEEGGVRAREEEVAALFRELETMASELTNLRRAGGDRLAQEVQGELLELNMPGATLQLKLEPTGLSARGAEKGELLFSANKGESPKPLQQIASGGELSRITLVLKKILKEQLGVNVLVFDEVDTGISGSVARAVGKKLKALATHSQVICITHLPQVASLADHHFVVEKIVTDRTISRVRKLTPRQRVEEVARMLSGDKITKAARESARELIEDEGRL
jgi:DNA repair protein RecN (Recombination protein N)